MNFLCKPLSDSQLDLIAGWISKTCIEIGCGDGSLLHEIVRRNREIESAHGIDKEIKPHSNSNVIHFYKEYFSKWLECNEDIWKACRTVILCYPPNSPERDNMSDQVLKNLRSDQNLVLISSKPFHTITVTGTESFWNCLCSEFEVLFKEPLNSIDVAYLFKRGSSIETQQIILEGHNLWELEDHAELDAMLSKAS